MYGVSKPVKCAAAKKDPQRIFVPINQIQIPYHYQFETLGRIENKNPTGTFVNYGLYLPLWLKWNLQTFGNPIDFLAAHDTKSGASSLRFYFSGIN